MKKTTNNKTKQPTAARLKAAYDDLITLTELAELAHCHPLTIKRKIYAGKLHPVAKMAHMYIFSRKSLEELQIDTRGRAPKAKKKPLP